MYFFIDFYMNQILDLIADLKMSQIDRLEILRIKWSGSKKAR
jgi:hypothetical protein